MSEELIGVLIGGFLAVAGGIIGTLLNYVLEVKREDRKRAEELLERARKQMFGDRVLRAEIEAWVADARERKVPVDLYRAELAGTDLAHLDLSEAGLGRANLSEADLRGAELEGAYLREADLSGTDLREAKLGGADLSWADLRGADLRGADLRRAYMDERQLRDAMSFEGATLPDGTKFTGEAETAPSEPEPQDAKEQPDRPDDLDASEGDHA